MKNYISGFINNQSRWWLLWGIVSPFLLIICFFFSIFIHKSFLVVEFLPSALFGLWIYDKNSFFINLKKFIFLLLLLIPLILFFGITFVWISISIVFLVMWLLKFKKEEFLWSFGIMLLYGFLSTIPLFSILFISNFDLQQSFENIIYNIFSIIAIIFVGYFVKGAIFGAILQVMWNKRIK